MFEEFCREDGIVVRELTVSGKTFRTFLTDTADGRSTADRAWWQSYLRGSVAESKSRSTGTLRYVDVFSGCGGLSLGVAEAAKALGFSVESVAAVDVDGPALKVYAKNLRPRLTINEDASSLVDYMVLGNGPTARFAYRPEIIYDELEAAVGEVDYLIAGPPCQGHSNLNNRTRRDDPRNQLYLTTIAIAAALGVRGVLVENVPDVVKDKNSVVYTAMALLKNSGYTFVDSAVLATDKLGGAQTRKRYFLTAIRGDQPAPATSLEAARTAFARKPNSVKWAIGDLERAKINGVMNSIPALSAENLLRINYLFENEINDLPNHVRPDCHREGTTYKSVYGRMWWDKPAPTITTGFLTPGRGRFIHPRQRRVITPHEAARLQFFPDSYTFLGATPEEPSRNLLSKWIGDAVPPLLGYAAAMPMLSSLVAR